MCNNIQYRKKETHWEEITCSETKHCLYEWITEYKETIEKIFPNDRLNFIRVLNFIKSQIEFLEKCTDQPERLNEKTPKGDAKV